MVGNPDYMVFDHYYRDPLHPRCQRRVQVRRVPAPWRTGGYETRGIAAAFTDSS